MNRLILSLNIYLFLNYTDDIYYAKINKNMVMLYK